MTTVRLIDVFESRGCSRCGGSGTYSFTPRFGTTCFKCGGKPFVPGSGYVLTPLGAKAHAAWIAANTDDIPASDLAVGDVFDPYGDGRRAKVTEVKRAEPGADFGWSSSTIGGVTIKTVHDLMVITGNGSVYRGMASDTIVHRWVAGRFALPPVMDPGTKRAAEMRAYIAAAAAVHEAVPA